MKTTGIFKKFFLVGALAVFAVGALPISAQATGEIDCEDGSNRTEAPPRPSEGDGNNNQGNGNTGAQGAADVTESDG